MRSFQALVQLPALASLAFFPRVIQEISGQEQKWARSVGPEPFSLISGAPVLNHRVQRKRVRVMAKPWRHWVW